MTDLRNTDEWGLVPEDDMFHQPTTGDPWWTETTWFSFMIPERNLMCYWYLVYRKNIGVVFGGVLIWDHTAVLPWELPVFDWHWHDPMTEDPDLRDLTALNNMRLRCVEHGKKWVFGYDHDGTSFEMTFESLMQPMLTRESPPFHLGTHVDQPGRVTGRLVLDGEELEVDCIAMRDRFWGVRPPKRQAKIGYCHATSGPNSSFLVISVERGGVDAIQTGYLMRDGIWRAVVSGHRYAERDEAGRPATVRIEGKDEDGRGFEARGTIVSRQVFTAYPNMFCWDSLVRWEFDGETAWGEDQDVWHPRKWRKQASERGTVVL
jgi:hypothetical protein